MIRAIFPIEPVAWQRPRFNGKIGFTASVVRKFESSIAILARNLMVPQPLEGPLKVSIAFYLTPPKTTKNYFPCVRPDLDNFIKGVLDSLNGIFWNDDGQICELYCRKYYGWSERKGSIEVEVVQLPIYDVPKKTKTPKVLP